MKIRMIVAAIAAMFLMGCASVPFQTITTVDIPKCKAMTVVAKEHSTIKIHFNVPSHAPDFTKWEKPRITSVWGTTDGVNTYGLTAIDYFKTIDGIKGNWGLAVWYERHPVVGGETDTMQFKETATVLWILEQYIDDGVKTNTWYEVYKDDCDETTKAKIIKEIMRRIIEVKNKRSL